MEPSDADESAQTLVAVADDLIELSVADELSQLSVVDGTTAAMLRVRSDLNNLDIPVTCAITFPNGRIDPMTLEVTICPDEGHYRDGKFVFSIDIPSSYPYEPPKAKCKTWIFHPNINYEGSVYLNILREDWVPVLDINIVIYGLYNLLLEPNWEISLNMDAAIMMVLDPESFDAVVQESIPKDLPMYHFSDEEDLNGFDMWRN